MFENRTFYFGSVRKVTSVFGNLFNNITIRRTDASDNELNRWKVPLSYGPKSVYIAKKYETISDDGAPKVAAVLPRLSFYMTGMAYNPTRKLNTLNRNGGPGDNLRRSKQLMSVPYDFNFELVAYAKYMEDGLQIVEQILPYFAPQISVKFKENAEMGIWNDAQIVLEGVTPEDNFEDQMDTNRVLAWTFNFTVTSNIYPPVDSHTMITKSIADINDNVTGDDIENVVVEATGEPFDLDSTRTTIVKS